MIKMGTIIRTTICSHTVQPSKVYLHLQMYRRETTALHNTQLADVPSAPKFHTLTAVHISKCQVAQRHDATIEVLQVVAAKRKQ